MASLFNWKQTEKIDNEFFVTYVEDSKIGDYTNFPDPLKNVKRVVVHPEFPIMTEKLHSIYITDGVIESFLSWTPDLDQDIQYMMNNFERVPYSADPRFVTYSIDNNKRVMCWSYDSEKFPKNEWLERDQQWAPTLPTRLESGRDGTLIVCITVNPDYRWKFRRCNLTVNSSIQFIKPNSNDFYIYVTRHDVLINDSTSLKKNSLTKIKSSLLDISAPNGESSVCIIERSEAVQ